MTLEFVLHILFPTRSQQFFCFNWDVTWTRLSPVTVKVSSRLNETSWDVQLLFSSSNRRTEEGLFRFDSLVDKTNVIKSKFVSFYHLYSSNKIRNRRSFFIRRIKVVRRVSSSCCCWVCLFFIIERLNLLLSESPPQDGPWRTASAPWVSLSDDNQYDWLIVKYFIVGRDAVNPPCYSL